MLMCPETLWKHACNIQKPADFQQVALAVFHHQVAHNEVYSTYCHHLGVEPAGVTEIEQIPFLPISFFRTHRIISRGLEAKLIFESSGTTSEKPSRHYVAEPGIYQESFSVAFRQVYGTPEAYCILALLPAYLERAHSSLVYMADHLIRQSKDPLSGFYLDRYDMLHETMKQLRANGRKTLLLGVTFALLDLAAQYPLEFPELILLETGGMKGRRREMVRAEVHHILSNAFSVMQVHSEYGMTELLSQAYSTGKGLFKPPPWMRVLVRDVNDPLRLIGTGKTGGISIIDLANIHSCAFIATQDLGKVYPDGAFEVLGRFDHSDVRGCNLMVTD